MDTSSVRSWFLTVMAGLQGAACEVVFDIPKLKVKAWRGLAVYAVQGRLEQLVCSNPVSH